MNTEKYRQLPVVTPETEVTSANQLQAENLAYEQTLATLRAVASELRAFDQEFILNRTNLKPVVMIADLSSQYQPLDPKANPDRLIRYSVSYLPIGTSIPAHRLATPNSSSHTIAPEWDSNTKLKTDLSIDYPFDGHRHIGGAEVRPVASITVSGLVNKEMYDKTIGVRAVLGRYAHLGPAGLSVITAYLDRNNPEAAAQLTEDILRLIYPLIDQGNRDLTSTPTNKALGWRQRLLGKAA